jgi:hypothetical protein
MPTPNLFDATAHVHRLDWARIGEELDAEGYALLPDLMGTDAARALAQRMHLAEDKQGAPLHAVDASATALLYFGASLPAPLAALRAALYAHLAVIANRWNQTLGMGERYPATLDAFLERNRDAHQTHEQSYMNRLVAGDLVPLHQRNDGAQVFPMQVVAALSAPGTDFQGGEFVMTEQRPRMQSRPLVLPLQRGDLAIIATAQRPVQGSKGYYGDNLRHAVSRVRHGERIGLELSFHNAR